MLFCEKFVRSHAAIHESLLLAFANAQKIKLSANNAVNKEDKVKEIEFLNRRFYVCNKP